MRLKVTITLAAAALLGGLTACNNELDEPRADQVPENAVRITAGIANPFAATRSMPTGTAEEQTKFKAGDEILVYAPNSDQHATYRFDGTAWKPRDGKYLLWKSDQEDFRAFYPAEWGSVHISGAPYDYQTDQSTEENIAKADLMVGDLNHQAKTKEPLHFTMQRWMARFIVKIAGFNSEFPADAKVDNVRFLNKIGSSGPLVTYTPYAEGRGEAGSTYTVLVPDNASDHTVSLTVGDKTMTAKLRDYTPDRGKSYTYHLTVGKEKLEVGEVKVADWTGSTVITGGEAEAD
ncbi:fimbrillin-like protein [Bacteroides heparinolyticus]|uniref:Fimbrillin-like protein n=1 Tax=Prevotella heparinolytica TaxID=28113 RepID=A0A4R2M704_9BACE|nr:fimbrillin family protein [Bacteroides heparinolyticus]TCO92582.1 fimbrillin-like protein [Bacteroides heparinolyticus]